MMDKKSRFGPGDLIKSVCGDYGVVKEVGKRPDDGVPGVCAFWFKEGMSFWMNEDEPQIELAAKKKNIDKNNQE